MKPWEGIANDDTLTVAQKRAAREGHDLPEEVDAHIRQRFIIGQEMTMAWAAGIVDIMADTEDVAMKMTTEQADLWMKVRDS